MEEGIQKLPNTSSVVRRSLNNEIREATLPVQKESTGAGVSYNEQSSSAIEFPFKTGDIGAEAQGSPQTEVIHSSCKVRLCDTQTPNVHENGSSSKPENAELTYRSYDNNDRKGKARNAHGALNLTSFIYGGVVATSIQNSIARAVNCGDQNMRTPKIARVLNRYAAQLPDDHWARELHDARLGVKNFPPSISGRKS